MGDYAGFAASAGFALFPVLGAILVILVGIMFGHLLAKFTWDGNESPPANPLVGSMVDEAERLGSSWRVFEGSIVIADCTLDSQGGLQRRNAPDRLSAQWFHWNSDVPGVVMSNLRNSVDTQVRHGPSAMSRRRWTHAVRWGDIEETRNRDITSGVFAYVRESYRNAKFFIGHQAWNIIRAGFNNDFRDSFALSEIVEPSRLCGGILRRIGSDPRGFQGSVEEGQPKEPNHRRSGSDPIEPFRQTELPILKYALLGFPLLIVGGLLNSRGIDFGTFWMTMFGWLLIVAGGLPIALYVVTSLGHYL